jgi:homogentisate 1,2-dioxygenase
MPASSIDLPDLKEYQKIFHWAETQKDGTIPSFNKRKNDPYEVSKAGVLENELLRRDC